MPMTNPSVAGISLQIRKSQQLSAEFRMQNVAVRPVSSKQKPWYHLRSWLWLCLFVFCVIVGSFSRIFRKRWQVNCTQKVAVICRVSHAIDGRSD